MRVITKIGFDKKNGPTKVGGIVKDFFKLHSYNVYDISYKQLKRRLVFVLMLLILPRKAANIGNANIFSLLTCIMKWSTQRCC